MDRTEPMTGMTGNDAFLHIRTFLRAYEAKQKNPSQPVTAVISVIFQHVAKLQAVMPGVTARHRSMKHRKHFGMRGGW